MRGRSQKRKRRKRKAYDIGGMMRKLRDGRERRGIRAPPTSVGIVICYASLGCRISKEEEEEDGSLPRDRYTYRR